VSDYRLFLTIFVLYEEWSALFMVSPYIYESLRTNAHGGARNFIFATHFLKILGSQNNMIFNGLQPVKNERRNTVIYVTSLRPYKTSTH